MCSLIILRQDLFSFKFLGQFEQLHLTCTSMIPFKMVNYILHAPFVQWLGQKHEPHRWTNWARLGWRLSNYTDWAEPRRSSSLNRPEIRAWARNWDTFVVKKGEIGSGNIDLKWGLSPGSLGREPLGQTLMLAWS